MPADGRFGDFGGLFVPEILIPALEELEAAFAAAQGDASFNEQLADLLRNYAGRPTPLYACRNLARETGATLYLKREDLLHGGAHKTNQVIGQGLLARRMNKSRIIAETGAGQHGVATAMVGALLGLKTRVYMGAVDAERQKPNVFRMELLGAEVVRVPTGGATLKDAVNEALRDWAESYPSTHYVLGTAAGPHPFPTMVRELQRVIGEEARAQFLEAEGTLPDVVVACVGGGSNAIGMFSDFLADPVELVGVEAGGEGLETGAHGPPSPGDGRGFCTAPAPWCSRTTTVRSRRRTPFRRASTTPGWGRNTPISRRQGGCGTQRPPTRRRFRPSVRWRNTRASCVRSRVRMRWPTP